MLNDSSVFSGYSVSDQGEAEKFYREILGFEVEDNGMGLGINFPSGHRVFLYQKDDHTPASFTVLNFIVTDINATVDELVAKGIVMERYPEMPGQQDDRGVMRGKAANMGPDIAWFKDPAGNILSVLEN